LVVAATAFDSVSPRKIGNNLRTSTPRSHGLQRNASVLCATFELVGETKPKRGVWHTRRP
jgi:hypothetical protein